MIDGKLALGSLDVAREAVALFEQMNGRWWAGPVEAYIYNEFADALREGMRTGVLEFDDLMADDAFVLARLDSSDNALIAQKLANVRFPRPELVRAYSPRIIPKEALARPAGSVKRHHRAALLVGTKPDPHAAGAGFASGMIDRSDRRALPLGPDLNPSLDLNPGPRRAAARLAPYQ